MGDSLADALPKEIARVSAKRDRWRDMMREYPDLSLAGVKLSLAFMEREIQNAIKACASGDVVAMIAAYEALKGYSNDD